MALGNNVTFRATAFAACLQFCGVFGFQRAIGEFPQMTAYVISEWSVIIQRPNSRIAGLVDLCIASSPSFTSHTAGTARASAHQIHWFVRTAIAAHPRVIFAVGFGDLPRFSSAVPVASVSCV